MSLSSPLALSPPLPHPSSPSMEITMDETHGSNASTGSNYNDNDGMLAVVKGKRTKRQRAASLPPPPAATAASSSTSSSDLSGATTEEEEDMANCLILLAQGGPSVDAGLKPDASPAEEPGAGDSRSEKFTSRRFAEAATTTNGKAGFYVYECKTCNKCFPSFQALGGHRASHKKPKLVNQVVFPNEKKVLNDEDNHNIQINNNACLVKPVASPSSNANNSSKPRVHECSICGSEFSSGQALGGHMRRHRPLNVPEAPEAKKDRAVLSLDLNLPAPSEEDRADFAKTQSIAFPFTAPTKQPLAFSVSALVDCHY